MELLALIANLHLQVPVLIKLTATIKLTLMFFESNFIKATKVAPTSMQRQAHPNTVGANLFANTNKPQNVRVNLFQINRIP